MSDLCRLHTFDMPKQSGSTTSRNWVATHGTISTYELNQRKRRTQFRSCGRRIRSLYHSSFIQQVASRILMEG